MATQPPILATPSRNTVARKILPPPPSVMVQGTQAKALLDPRKHLQLQQQRQLPAAPGAHQVRPQTSQAVGCARKGAGLAVLDHCSPCSPLWAGASAPSCTNSHRHRGTPHVLRTRHRQVQLQGDVLARRTGACPPLRPLSEPRDSSMPRNCERLTNCLVGTFKRDPRRGSWKGGRGRPPSGVPANGHGGHQQEGVGQGPRLEERS